MKITQFVIGCILIAVFFKCSSACTKNMCMRWDTKMGNLLLICNVRNRKFVLQINGPKTDLSAVCIPFGRCSANANLTVNKLSNVEETIMVLTLNASEVYNGRWSCRHGINAEESNVEVAINQVPHVFSAQVKISGPKYIQRNKPLHLNCSSTVVPLLETVEFLVNNKSYRNIYLDGGKCYNRQHEECNDGECMCYDNGKSYYLQYKETSQAELKTFTCSMIFKSVRNPIKDIINIQIVDVDGPFITSATGVTLIAGTRTTLVCTVNTTLRGYDLTLNCFNQTVSNVSCSSCLASMDIEIKSEFRCDMCRCSFKWKELLINEIVQFDIKKSPVISLDSTTMCFSQEPVVPTCRLSGEISAFGFIDWSHSVNDVDGPFITSATGVTLIAGTRTTLVCTVNTTLRGYDLTLNCFNQTVSNVSCSSCLASMDIEIKSEFRCDVCRCSFKWKELLINEIVQFDIKNVDGPFITSATGVTLIAGTRTTLVCTVNTTLRGYDLTLNCFNQTVSNVSCSSCLASMDIEIKSEFRCDVCRCAFKWKGLLINEIVQFDIKKSPVISLDSTTMCFSQEPVVLTCRLSGEISAFGFIDWSHSVNGKLIRHIMSNETGNTAKLAIKSCTYMDIGDYRCTAYNNDRNETIWANKTTTIIMIGPPVVVYSSIAQGVFTVLTIFCYSVSILNETKWYFFEEYLENTSMNVQVMTEEIVDLPMYNKIADIPVHVINLTIREAKSGFYNVIITNRHGEAKHQFKLKKDVDPFNLSVIIWGLIAIGIFLVTFSVSTIVVRGCGTNAASIIHNTPVIYHAAPYFEPEVHSYDVTDPKYDECDVSMSGSVDLRINQNVGVQLRNSKSSSIYEEVI